MTAAACPDDEFIRLLELDGPAAAAKSLGISIRSVYNRRRRLENKLGRSLTVAVAREKNRLHELAKHPQRVTRDIVNGTILIGSDAHYWPGLITTAHRAFMHFAKELQPTIVCLNGDVIDGARISRHQPIGWENRPEVIQEIEACKERVGEIERAAPNALRVWTLGNHDSRFETRLATVAPEYARVHGFHLKDHFPYWQPCWSLWINEDVVIKHRFKAGIHAPHNNTMWAGRSIFTGHLHSLKVMPLSDYNGTRFGVDTGTIAEPYGPQFRDYTEDSPTNWRSGFIVATIHKGRLLWPEIVHVLEDGVVEFRGKVVEV